MCDRIKLAHIIPAQLLKLISNFNQILLTLLMST